MLKTPVVFVMENISPTAHLSILISVLVTDLAALLPLRWQLIRLGSNSELFRQAQTWIMISKCAMDTALVCLLVLDTSKGIDDGKQRLVRTQLILQRLIPLGEQFELALKVLLRFSINCVSISEVCLLTGEYIKANANVFSQLLFTRQIFPGVNLRHCGWWWRKLGPVVIFTLTLLRFLPLIEYSHASIVEFAYTNPKCSLHKDTLHFWTVFNASFLEFLLFNLIYWWTLMECKDHQKWRSGLAGSCIIGSAVVLAALMSLATGWKLPWIRHLLLEVMKKVI